MVKFRKFVIFCILFLLIIITLASAITTRYIDNVAEVSGGEVSYKVNDRLGSQRVIVDEGGEIVAEFKSLPYGQIVEDSGSKYGFTGKEKDVSTGLHYFSARYYDSSTGRFAGIDSVKDNHPYSYVANNPMNYVDPSGMIEEKSNISTTSEKVSLNVQDIKLEKNVIGTDKDFDKFLEPVETLIEENPALEAGVEILNKFPYVDLETSEVSGMISDSASKSVKSFVKENFLPPYQNEIERDSTASIDKVVLGSNDNEQKMFSISKSCNSNFGDSPDVSTSVRVSNPLNLFKDGSVDISPEVSLDFTGVKGSDLNDVTFSVGTTFQEDSIKINRYDFKFNLKKGFNFFLSTNVEKDVVLGGTYKFK